MWAKVKEGQQNVKKGHGKYGLPYRQVESVWAKVKGGQQKIKNIQKGN